MLYPLQARIEDNLTIFQFLRLLGKLSQLSWFLLPTSQPPSEIERHFFNPSAEISSNILRCEPRKNPSDFPLYWLVNRDSYDGLKNNPYITG